MDCGYETADDLSKVRANACTPKKMSEEIDF